MIATLGLTLRLHRFEVAAFGALAVLGAVLTVVVSGRLDEIGFGAACNDPNGMFPAGCEAIQNAFYERVGEAGKVTIILTAVPFLAALLLGVQIVGRELDRGTTRLAWALAPSRTTWLAHRLVPVLLFVAVAGLLSGVAADRLLASTEPGLDPANAFAQFGFRGVVLAGRALFVFSLAVLVGAVMGRVLPALIVAGLLAVVGISGGTQVHFEIIEREAVVIDEQGRGDWGIDQRFRLPNGDLVGWEEIDRYDPPPSDPASTEPWPTLPQVFLAVPGTRYGEVQLREMGALAGGSLVALLATVFVVQRRRPG